MVFNVLASESFLIAYNAYQQITTQENLEAFTRYVVFIETLKQFTRVDSDQVLHLFDDLMQILVQNFANILRIVGIGVFRMIDLNVMRETGALYIDATEKTDMITQLEAIQRHNLDHAQRPQPLCRCYCRSGLTAHLIPIRSNSSNSFNSNSSHNSSTTSNNRSTTSNNSNRIDSSRIK